MLIGIPVDIHRDDAGHFICEVQTNEIADALRDQLGDIAGLYGQFEYDEDERADQKDAQEILTFLDGPMGHLVKWTFQ